MAYIIEEENNKEVRCTKCGSLIRYTEDDTYFSEDKTGTTGLCIDCPKCNNVILTKPVKPGLYPESFFDFSGGMDIDNFTIQQWVNDCVDAVKHSDGTMDYAYRGSGNTLVIAYWTDDDEITVMVAKNYKETAIYI